MDHPEVPFESAKLLVLRAKENIADFDTRYQAFVDSRPYATLHEDEPKTLNKILKIKMTKPIPQIMRTVYSDALNNLRHALDQAVNDAAILLRGGKRDCYFPFAHNAAAFTVIYNAKRYKTVPIELRPHIETLQPYFGGNDTLYALSKVTGRNKHQVVLRLAADPGSITLNNVRGHGFVMLDGVWDSAKGELPIARVLPYGILHTDVSIAPIIGVDDPAFVGIEKSGPLGKVMISTIEAITDGIEAETYRLLGERDHGQASAPGP